MTELAKDMIEDGQPFRSIFEYLNSTYDDIKGKEFFAGQVFNDRIEFMEYIQKCVCTGLIHSLNEWKLDNEEDYIETN